MPPTITYEEAKGFGLFMLKAVLNGRGDEIIDLARTRANEPAPLIDPSTVIFGGHEHGEDHA